MNNMDESLMLNYDDVFFCYHTEKGKVFDKTIDHHMLVFVHSGELTIGTKSETLHIRQGGCVFLHRNPIRSASSSNPRPMANLSVAFFSCSARVSSNHIMIAILI